jgi:hypothetical protein
MRVPATTGLPIITWGSEIIKLFGISPSSLAHYRRYLSIMTHRRKKGKWEG